MGVVARATARVTPTIHGFASVRTLMCHGDWGPRFGVEPCWTKRLWNKAEQDIIMLNSPDGPGCPRHSCGDEWPFLIWRLWAVEYSNICSFN